MKRIIYSLLLPIARAALDSARLHLRKTRQELLSVEPLPGFYPASANESVRQARSRHLQAEARYDFWNNVVQYLHKHTL